MNVKCKRGNALPAVCFVLLVLSVLLNVALLRGSRSAQPERIVQHPTQPVSPSYLREIAEKIGLHPLAGRSASDLAGDICIALDEARQDVVKPIPADVFKAMTEVLGPKDLEYVRRQNDFIQSLAGKNVFALPRNPKPGQVR